MAEDIKSALQGRRIVVTGAAGTIGQVLVEQLLALPVAEVRALDHNESVLFDLSQRHGDEPRYQAFLADMADGRLLRDMFRGMDCVFHVAALKHVTLCERSPSSAVETNILGTQNVIDAAVAGGVRKVLLTSSDKAVNPTNVMGTSKLMGERLMTAANATIRDSNATVFASTRFGNVAGTRGSVIPLFCQQIAAGGPVTLTDDAMTRFMMTVDEAVEFVIRSLVDFRGGEVFVTKMPVLRIVDLAEVMIELIAPVYGHCPADVEIKRIGAHPGEKLFEELLSEEEVRRTVDLGDFYAIIPAIGNIYGAINHEYEGSGPGPSSTYRSSDQPAMSCDEVRSFLLRPRVLPDTLRAALLATGETRATPPAVEILAEAARATAPSGGV